MSRASVNKGLEGVAQSGDARDFEERIQGKTPLQLPALEVLGEPSVVGTDVLLWLVRTIS